ncbi:MAG TPA: hypothetical protein VEP67_12510 [Thiobacillaceae bacterium]|nr:hypothetical protein [Thiobacillaceae bacterium]
MSTQAPIVRAALAAEHRGHGDSQLDSIDCTVQAKAMIDPGGRQSNLPAQPAVDWQSKRHANCFAWL